MWGSLTEPGNSQQSEQVFGAQRDPSSGAWGGAEAISARERGPQPRAAFDPVSGKPWVVWSGQPGSPPLGQPSYAQDQSLRLASRGAWKPQGRGPGAPRG